MTLIRQYVTSGTTSIHFVLFGQSLTVALDGLELTMMNKSTLNLL